MLVVVEVEFRIRELLVSKVLVGQVVAVLEVQLLME
jgi:hypothetical protein